MAENNLPRYVASGTYGCVMRPAVNCENTKKMQKTKPVPVPSISKLFTDAKDALEEFDMHSLMTRIDPRGIFTIQIRGKCVVPSDKFVMSELKKCNEDDDKVLFVKQKEFHQIVFEDGGRDLDLNFKTLQKGLEEENQVGFKELFVGMHSIFDGLVLMAKNNLSHLDIKPDNIVYNQKTMKMSLIDFGLCQPIDVIYTPAFDKAYYKHPYIYYPPEFVVFENAKLNNRNFIGMMKMFGALKHDFGPDFEAFLWNDWHEMLDNFNPDDFIKNKWGNVIDVYMMGVTLFQLWICLPRDDLCNAKPFIQDFITLVVGMIRLNPKYRYTPENARDEYNKLVAKWNLDNSASAKIKSPVIKNIKSLVIKKPCPPGQMRHPETKRCRKVKPTNIK